MEQNISLDPRESIHFYTVGRPNKAEGKPCTVQSIQGSHTEKNNKKHSHSHL